MGKYGNHSAAKLRGRGRVAAAPVQPRKGLPGAPRHPDPRFPAGPGTVGVVAPAQMRGLLGDTVELPCKLQPLEYEVHVTQVTWTRRDAAGDDLNVAVFHPTQGPSFPEPGRLEFVAARPGEELRDGSLALRGLRAEDEANYTCRFAMFPEGSRSARTWLRVLGEQGSGDRRELRGVGWGGAAGGGGGAGMERGDSVGTKGGDGAMIAAEGAGG